MTPPPVPAPPPGRTAGNILGERDVLLRPLGRCRPTAGGVLNLATVLRRLLPQPSPRRGDPDATAADPDADGAMPTVLTWLDGATTRWLDTDLLAAAHRRRHRALHSATTTRAGLRWRRWRLRPLPGSTFALDLGDTTNPWEIGIPLHGTYGWPVVPGSALKGLAAHTAADLAATDAGRILGTTGRRGDVTILDALPEDATLTVTRATLAPHHPRYTADAQAPPADWDQPVPVSYLTVQGTFLVDILGPDHDPDSGRPNDPDTVGSWLAHGLDATGLGGKTTSGHGYARLEPIDLPGASS